MSLLQRIIEHLQNLVLVSDTTLMLMGVSIILMSIAYFYCVIIKNNKYEKIIVIIGIVVRILMIIGFTIEFSHQKAIYQGSGVINDKYSSMEQFSNYLFYGYIFVIGIYDIFTIGINKFRGFFHAFDLTMMSIPILYALTTILLNFSFQEETLYGVIIVIVLSVLPFIFFKLYWKQNIKWYSIFFAYIVIILIVYKISAIRTFFISTLISYLLVGMYEFLRFLFYEIKATFSISLWSKFKVLSIIFPLVLIYSSMITLNIPPLQINKKYYINSFYKENASFTSLQEAESLARVAVDDKNSYIKLSQGNSENFTNRYIFSIGDYSVEIDGATGKIFQITMLNENKINVKGNLNEEEIKGKTISWLKKIGFTYSENKSLIKIEKQTNQYTVNIFNKYNDGSVDDRSSCSIQWYDNGKLCSAIIGTNLFDIKDYKEIKIDEAAINSNIKKWYEKSGESAPSYIIDSFSYWFGENNTYIQVKCKNNDGLLLNPYNGQIVNFNKNASGNEKITQEIYEKNKSKAEQLAKIYSNSWSNLNYKLEDTSFNENGNYTFISNKGILTNLINVKLDFQGNISAFSEINNSFSKTKLYSDKAFKISSTTALTLIANKYMPFGIYTKRVKLAVEVNEKGNINYKWMVMVVPFKDVEHQIYYVDVNTGKIDPLLDYK